MSKAVRSGLDGKTLDIDRQGVPDGKAALFIRPFNIAIVAGESADTTLAGKVARIHGLGAARRIEVRLRRIKTTG